MSEYFPSEDFFSFPDLASQFDCDVEPLQNLLDDAISTFNEPWLDQITETGSVTRADITTIETDWEQQTEETSFLYERQLYRSPSSSSSESGERSPSSSSSESELTLGDFDTSFSDAFVCNDNKFGFIGTTTTTTADISDVIDHVTNGEAVGCIGHGYGNETQSGSAIPRQTAGVRSRRTSVLLQSPGHKQTAEYRRSREKNNEAVKRCRERKRRQDQRNGSEVEQLRAEIRRLQLCLQAMIVEKYGLNK